jgi:hypothetical protein
MMIFVLNFSRQHTRTCDWEAFKGSGEFLEQVQRKGEKLGNMMVYERKQQMREKHLKQPSHWILGTIKRELNLFNLCSNEMLDDLHRQHDTALAYWRKNRRQYPPEGFGTNIILICYVPLLSQGMSSGLGVRQGRSS